MSYQYRTRDEEQESARKVMAFLFPKGASGWAIATGVSIVLIELLIGIPFLLPFGILALRDISRHPEKTGKGVAWLGTILGAIAYIIAGCVLVSCLKESWEEQRAVQAEWQRLEHDMAEIETLNEQLRGGEISLSVEEIPESPSQPQPKDETPALNEELRAGETRKPGETKTITLPGGAELEMVWCPPGAFMMGSLESYDEIMHQVVLSAGFWMGKTEVTQTQWTSVMGSNPSSRQREGLDLPVENVDWNDCLEFCLRTGLRLPTEAEWEYACRAETTGVYGGPGKLDEMGWTKDNSEGRIHPVGKKQPNAWGLFDMHGNVWEWCIDAPVKYGKADMDPVGEASYTSDRIILRGGSFMSDASRCRSSNREDTEGYYKTNERGFRVCCSEGPRKAERIAQAVIATINKKLRAGETQNPGDTKTIQLPGGVEMEMVWCPPGAFWMGSSAHEAGRGDDEKQHLVTLSEGFWMGKTEVTQAQWRGVIGDNPSEHKGDAPLPVENVAWNQCQEFCKKTGLRLPTEAQWEYACRAGSTGPFGGTGKSDEMGWYRAVKGTQPVGQKQPNAWGLHDMHGNVQEWCADWYAAYSKEAATDPEGPEDADERVSRGGSWRSGRASECRSAKRYHEESSRAYGGDQGFRVCCTATEMSAFIEKQRSEAARQPKAGATKTITLPGGAKMEMVWCPRGTFMMGSPKSEKGRKDDETQHQVTLSKGFWMAKTEVTQEQWKSVMGNNPSKHTSRRNGDNLPVEQVNWDECRLFCEKAGNGMRLPTEAEWEYACRAGSTGAVSGGAWFKGNSEGRTHPVGEKKANAWGLHDMHGNVVEWCADGYGNYPEAAVTNPQGRDRTDEKVIRGGCYWSEAQDCRSACRRKHSSWCDAHENYLGFRPVMLPTE